MLKHDLITLFRHSFEGTRSHKPAADQAYDAVDGFINQLAEALAGNFPAEHSIQKRAEQVDKTPDLETLPNED